LTISCRFALFFAFVVFFAFQEFCGFWLDLVFRVWCFGCIRRFDRFAWLFSRCAASFKFRVCFFGFRLFVFLCCV